MAQCSPDAPRCLKRSTFGLLFLRAASTALRKIFPDGNKRTTVVISMALLHISGVVLDIEDPAEPDENEMYLWIQDVVTDSKTKEELAQILRDRVKCCS